MKYVWDTDTDETYATTSADKARVAHHCDAVRASQGGKSMNASMAHFEYKQEQAKAARRQAAELRELHKISRCGLDIAINYGTKYVPQHIAMRISDQFPIWADEYEAIADGLDRELEDSLSGATS